MCVIESDKRLTEKKLLKKTISSLYDQIISFDSSFSNYKDRISEIKEQIESGQINVAILGQFKRGKSSVINSLLEGFILPTSVLPLTNIPTYIKHCSEDKVEVYFEKKTPPDLFRCRNFPEIREILSRYVSEDMNPENHLNVEKVILYSKSDLLKNGLVLIDTPGIGSTNLHNTSSTLDFIPRCDAGIFVFSADPPITEVELKFLSDTKEKISKIFFVLNKIDLFDSENIHKIIEFYKKILAEKSGFNNPEIYPLSSKWFFENKSCNGVDRLKSGLLSFMDQEKNMLLSKMLLNKTENIVSDMMLQLNMSLRSYLLPIDELEKKCISFEKKISEVEKKKTNSFALLTFEKNRMFDLIEERSKKLRENSYSRLVSVIKNAVSKNAADQKEIFEAEVASLFDREFSEMTEFFNEKTTEVMAEYERSVVELLESVKIEASEIFEIVYVAQKLNTGVENRREAYWVNSKFSASFIPVPDEWIDRILPRNIRKQRIMKRFSEQADLVVTANVENLRWSIIQNVGDTFIKFISKMENEFLEIKKITIDAANSVVNKRKSSVLETEKIISDIKEQINKLEEFTEVLERT